MSRSYRLGELSDLAAKASQLAVSVFIDCHRDIFQACSVLVSSYVRLAIVRENSNRCIRGQRDDCPDVYSDMPDYGQGLFLSVQRLRAW